MKKQLLTLSFALCAAFGYSQSNIFPTTGNAGIGTTAPVTKFDVLTGQVISSPNTLTTNLAFFGSRSLVIQPQTPTNTGLYFQHIRYGGFGGVTTTKLTTTSADTPLGYTEFNTGATTNTTRAALSFGTAGNELMRINQNGKVRIASTDIKTPDGYKLFVEEGILTEKVKVALSTTADWADYVFSPDYKLMPLEEVEKFTKENNHLPNVPSAADMVTQGLDVAKMDAKLLEKIEELTLYAVQQNNENKELRAELEAQTTATKAVNDKQTKEIEELKEMVKVLLEKK